MRRIFQYWNFLILTAVSVSISLGAGADAGMPLRRAEGPQSPEASRFLHCSGSIECHEAFQFYGSGQTLDHDREEFVCKSHNHHLALGGVSL